LEGFIVPPSSFAPAKKELLALLAADKLVHWETVVEGGLDAAPDALASLFVQGSEHVGKLIVKLSD
jgi:NADPH-dependent curcumin reductase CurA